MDHVAGPGGLGAATFPLLFFVSAPYGKLVRGGGAGRRPCRRFIQEIVSPITLTLAYLHGGDLFTFEDRGPRGSSSTPPASTQIFIVFWGLTT